MRFAAFLLTASLCLAQSVGLSLSGSTVPGSQATLTLTYTDASPSAGMAGLEWSVTTPSGITAGAPTIGAAATAANKVLSCGAGNNPCILAGTGTTPNDTAIVSGVLATVPLTIPATQPVGTGTVSLSGLTAVNAGGSAVTLTSNTVTISILSPFDLNADGAVNGADIAIMLQAALGIQPCSTVDQQVGDKKCSLHDLELVIEAALGKNPVNQ